MAKLQDLTGEVFGRLTVIKRTDDIISPNGRCRVTWLCMCSCGQTTITRGENLRRGLVKSCGCLHREVATKINTKHGKAKSRPYNIWSGMKARCDNKNSQCYHDYGGRGIRYGPKWATFEGFWEEMRDGYEDHLTLERVNVNGNYELSNCIWATHAVQSRNTRKRKHNSSGKNGVSCRTVGGGLKRYIATWQLLTGKQVVKSFSVKKYGEAEAFRLACEYRDEQIRILNGQGAGYSPDHGL